MNVDVGRRSQELAEQATAYLLERHSPAGNRVGWMMIASVFVEAWDLLARGREMRVPSRLWTASNEAVVAYLRSVFQADGSVSVQGGSSRVAIGVIGERWTEDLQVLLLRLGIYSRRLRKQERRSNRSDLHEIQVNMRSERLRFAERIGFLSAGKSARLAASRPSPGPRSGPPRPLKPRSPDGFRLTASSAGTRPAPTGRSRSSS